MNSAEQFSALMMQPGAVLALAPMQDVTDLPFWHLMHEYGGPDVYYTEYFRVHPTSHLEKPILRSLTGNKTGKPAIAQMIGNDVSSLVRSARELQQYPIMAVDLNLGCPAPVVYRKCAGGGLLREPKRIDGILGALRDAVQVKFTVKTRIGFETPEVFEELLPIFAKHSLDLLTVHGRTVKEMYRSEVHYEYIRQAVEAAGCPVLANGNIYSPEKAAEVMRFTGAKGLMIGRAAIRNPWLFEQIRAYQRGEQYFVPRGREVLDYIERLYSAVQPEAIREIAQVQKMKKYLNYLGIGVEPSGEFLHQIRRAVTKEEFFNICRTYLDHDDLTPLLPYELNLKQGDLMAGEHC
ncbi:MAG: tRNA-dihydrouridine synthase family protein [Verrucomicrobiota bacterium]|nr:tRNA-dihydrouridine synthase family protein [Verrucomicrobiota bacterium]